jgi:hypothetical protein
VKLAEFSAICEREWTRNAPEPLGFGDVTCLRLTDASYQELCADVMGSERFLQLARVDPTMLAVKLRQLVNPVTRSVVTVLPGNDGNTVIVAYHPDAPTAEVPA